MLVFFSFQNSLRPYEPIVFSFPCVFIPLYNRPHPHTLTRVSPHTQCNDWSQLSCATYRHTSYLSSVSSLRGTTWTVTEYPIEARTAVFKFLSPFYGCNIMSSSHRKHCDAQTVSNELRPTKRLLTCATVGDAQLFPGPAC